ncbi:MAG TPA: hypothetical protein VI997_00435 [Candidatus Thermoplasmatota archaeon]|nr:hypothetical protein [Candidatus Thermoplasmatota archaeon]
MPEPADEQKLANERTKHTGEPKGPREPKDVERPASRERSGDADERDEKAEEAGRSKVERL